MYKLAKGIIHQLTTMQFAAKVELLQSFSLAGEKLKLKLALKIACMTFYELVPDFFLSHQHRSAYVHRTANHDLIA